MDPNSGTQIVIHALWEICKVGLFCVAFLTAVVAIGGGLWLLFLAASGKALAGVEWVWDRMKGAFERPEKDSAPTKHRPILLILDAAIVLLLIYAIVH